MKKNIKASNSLAEKRTDKKMTQEELANKVNVSIQTIQSTEKGKYKPSISLAFAIASLLDEKVDSVFP